MSADLTMQMATFWTTANAKALSYHKRLVRALVQDRQSSYRAPPTMHAEPPVLASSIPSRVKRLVATGLPGPPATTVALAAVDPYTQEEAKKKTKLDTLFQIALEDVLSLEQLGVTWETLEDAVILQGTKDVVLANASRLGLGRLSALIAAYRRWKRYAIEAGVEVNKPLPIQVALFLKKVSKVDLQQLHRSTKLCFGGRGAWELSCLWNIGWLRRGGCTTPATKVRKLLNFRRGSS